jgi:hypothetical protein
MPLGLANRMTTMLSSGAGNFTRNERVGCVHTGHALEVHMRMRKLRTNVVHVVGHAAQDRVGDGFGGITALGFVAPEFLNPLEIDDRHHANQQIGVFGDIDLGRDHRAVQAFVKQQVGAAGHIFPRRESARRSCL